MPSVMQTAKANARFVGLVQRVGRAGRRNEDALMRRAGCRDALLDGIEDRQAVLGLLPALTGRHAADDVGAVRQHASGVIGAFRAGDPLHDDLAVLVENRYVIAPHSDERTAWPRLRPSFQPASCRPRRESAGPLLRSFRSANHQRNLARFGRRSALRRCLRATSSPRVIPPKMLMNNTFAPV